MSSSRTKAIRIVVATAAASLLLSAACAAAFIISMSGMFKSEAAAPVRDTAGVYTVWCTSEEQYAFDEVSLSV